MINLVWLKKHVSCETQWINTTHTTPKSTTKSLVYYARKGFLESVTNLEMILKALPRHVARRQHNLNDAQITQTNFKYGQGLITFILDTSKIQSQYNQQYNHFSIYGSNRLNSDAARPAGFALFDFRLEPTQQRRSTPCRIYNNIRFTARTDSTATQHALQDLHNTIMVSQPHNSDVPNALQDLPRRRRRLN